MKKTFTTLGIAASVFGANSAYAQEAQTGVYGSIDIGIAMLDDVDVDYSDEGGTFGGTGTVDTVETSAKTKNAADYGASIGYDFGSIRADIEFDYSRNKISGLAIESINGTAVTTLDSDDADDFCDYVEVDNCSISGNTINFDGGKVRQASVMANAWFDIPVGEKISPYVGGGFGIGGFELEGEGKGRFAWQIGTGVAFSLSPSIALTADYRYRVLSGTTFTDAAFPEYAFRVGKLKTSTISAGIRFTF